MSHMVKDVIVIYRIDDNTRYFSIIKHQYWTKVVGVIVNFGVWSELNGLKKLKNTYYIC